MKRYFSDEEIILVTEAFPYTKHIVFVGCSLRFKYLSSRNDSIIVKKATINELNLLFKVCHNHTQRILHTPWNEGGLDWYLDNVNGLEVIKEDLVDPDINYFITSFNDEPGKNSYNECWSLI